MSIQLYCSKCKIHFGSISFADNADPSMIEDAEKSFASLAAMDGCQTWTECPHNEYSEFMGI